MQTRRLFSLIWRINAIVILLVGLIAGAVLSVAGYLLFKDATRTRHVDNVANTALGNVRETAAELGSFGEIPGASVLRAPLNVRQTYALGSGSKEAGSTRNYLYFEPSTRATSWLRPSMDGLILSSVPLPSAEYGEKKVNAVTYVHVTVDKDTDGDDRLTESDAKQIAISAPDGKGYRVLVTKADRLNDATLIGPTRLLILYSAGNKLNAVEVNPVDPAAPVTEYEVPTDPKS
jgi:hypothetical protein